jgi:biotin carboxyl carrier protein
MTFEVEINGRMRTVSLDPLGAVGPAGGRFRVVVHDAGGRAPVEVDVRPTDLGLSLLFAGDGRSLDVAVTDRAAGEHLVQFPHVAVTAVVDGRRARRGGGGPLASTGEQRVMAPMPGRIIRVLVTTGDEVEARQGLVVVEAMKMENELTAVRAGRIKEISVTEGQSVRAGQLLVIVE